MKVIHERPLRRYVVQERMYEFVTGEGEQMFGPWRAIASVRDSDEARGIMLEEFNQRTNHEYRVIDTKGESETTPNDVERVAKAMYESRRDTEEAPGLWPEWGPRVHQDYWRDQARVAIDALDEREH